MTTLDELKIRVDDLADMVRVTDSVAVRNDQLLRAQTSLMMSILALNRIQPDSGGTGTLTAEIRRWQDRMDRNVEAIMRHLGVEPDPS